MQRLRCKAKPKDARVPVYNCSSLLFALFRTVQYKNKPQYTQSAVLFVAPSFANSRGATPLGVAFLPFPRGRRVEADGDGPLGFCAALANLCARVRCAARKLAATARRSAKAARRPNTFVISHGPGARKEPRNQRCLQLFFFWLRLAPRGNPKISTAVHTFAYAVF